MNQINVNPTPPKNTAWINPTHHTVRFEVVEGEEAHRRVFKYEFKPGQRVEIPSEYDRAIRTVKDGVIVAGLAPQLVTADDEKNPVIMHEALASSAALGDLERQVHAGGQTSGRVALDVASRLQRENDDLRSRLAEQDRRLAALENAPVGKSAKGGNA